MALKEAVKEYIRPPDRQYKDDQPSKGDFRIFLSIPGLKTKGIFSKDPADGITINVDRTDSSLDVLVSIVKKGKDEEKFPFTLETLPYKINHEKPKWEINNGKGLVIILRKVDRDKKWDTKEFLESILVPTQARLQNEIVLLL